MSILARLRPGFRRQDTDAAAASTAPTSPDQLSPRESKSEVGASEVPVEHARDAKLVEAHSEDDAHQDIPGESLQRGVQDVEAVTLTWSKTSLVGIFCTMWMLYFVNSMQSAIIGLLVPFLTGEWDSSALLNNIYIVSFAISAAVYIPLSKMLDVMGRAEGFLFMTVCATLGCILMAACNSLTTFCVAYVFYTIGFSGMEYCVDVVTADASTLKNRALAYAFTSSPYIITAFASSNAADAVYYDIPNWQGWGIGMWAIITPVVAAPMYLILKINLRKAHANGLAVHQKSGRTFKESLWFYTVELDVLGVLAFSAGLVIFLLPFDIATTAPDGWSTGYIIAMLVVGLVVLIVFVLYEFFVAPKPMLNFTFLGNRTVLGACLLDITYQISYYCWANYFEEFLMVVNDLSINEAGYVVNAFDVVGGVILLIVGWVISKTGRYKWMLYIAIPLYIFSQGLMIYFRKPNQNVGYLVMCQVFISIGGSIFILIEQLAILAAVDHQHVAAVMALLYVVGTVGDAMGSTISGAIWQSTFYKALEMYLPAETLWNIEDIYDDYEVQLEYPVGNATRAAIQDAYGYAQTRMLAAGVAFMGLALIAMFLIRDINVHKTAQVKGTVF